MRHVYMDKDYNIHLDYNPAYIELDCGMGEIISILNKKGYKTHMCCAGHDIGELYTMVQFEKGIKVPKCPIGWKVEKNNLGNIRYCKRGKYSNKEKYKRLEELRCWVRGV